MLMRVVRAQTKPGQTDELARRWGAFFRGRREKRGRRPPGFRSAQFGIDRSGDRTMAASLWDIEPDEAFFGKTMRDFGAMVEDVITDPPTVERDEVPAEL